MTGSIFDLSATAGSNGTIEGVNVAEGCSAGSLNDGLRGLAAAIRNSFSSGLQTFLAGSAGLPVVNGGTGGTTQVTARTGLGAAASGTNSDITALTALSTPLSVAQGGTGGTDAASARASLGVLALTSTSNVEVGGYRVWSDSMKECWGYVDVPANSSSSVTFPVTYTTWVNVVLGGVTNPSPTEGQNTGLTAPPGFTGCTLYNAMDSTMRVHWQAKGV